jgi:hypothetical protein
MGSNGLHSNIPEVESRWSIQFGCDVESVDCEGLSEEFKLENCLYLRAHGPKEEYRGNRLNYETECNVIGWALAELNPCLRQKRDLLQRAVDSWRNSYQDPRLRSQRVRRQVKFRKQGRHLITVQVSLKAPASEDLVPPNVPQYGLSALADVSGDVVEKGAGGSDPNSHYEITTSQALPNIASYSRPKALVT